jgi:hypothetical protein
VTSELIASSLKFILQEECSIFLSNDQNHLPGCSAILKEEEKTEVQLRNVVLPSKPRNLQSKGPLGLLGQLVPIP